MLRRFALVATGIVVALSVHAAAQARPDFSGVWKLTEGPAGGFRSPFTIAQDASTATLTPAESAQGITVFLDGRPSPGPPPKTPEGIRNSLAAGSQPALLMRAAWMGDQVVVVAHTNVTLDKMPTIVFTNRYVFTLVDRNTMRIDSMSVEDPRPSPSRQPVPEMASRTYARVTK
jgi:hypothetical protein